MAKVKEAQNYTRHRREGSLIGCHCRCGDAWADKAWTTPEELGFRRHMVISAPNMPISTFPCGKVNFSVC